ncbi:hypothetical protein MRX96_030538 [Rhipicephalus microplus]
MRSYAAAVLAFTSQCVPRAQRPRLSASRRNPSPFFCPEVAIFTEGILITGSGCRAAGLGIVGGTIMVIADSWGSASLSPGRREGGRAALFSQSPASNLHGVLSTRRNRRAVPDHESCRRICPTAGTSGRTKTTSSTAKQPLAQPRAVASKARLCPSTSTPTRGAAPPVPGWERALSSGRTMRPPPDAFEEFVLDDSDLLRLCEPAGPHRPRRSAAPGGGASAGRRPPHLRTVSIIDTLSALARGAQDHREDVAAAEPWLPALPSRRPPRRPAQAVPRDWSRQYASDSELKSGGDACSVLSLRSQQPRRPAQRPPLARVPHWIRAIFRVAKKGDLDALVRASPG